MPGYGFSQKPTKPGIRARVADLWHELMTEKLGYEKFAAKNTAIANATGKRIRELPIAPDKLYIEENYENNN